MKKSSIGQVTKITSSYVGTGFPATLYSLVTYNPFGEVASATYGDSIVRTNTYDKMGRPTVIQDGSGSNTPLKVSLSYNHNGTVYTDQEWVSGTQTRGWTATYDWFNRIATASDSVSGLAYSYTYDEFGNRWKQHRTSGTGYDVSNTFDGNNRLNTAGGGFQYDVAGNLLNDGGSCGGGSCYQYDNTGHVVYNYGATYAYDAIGKRTEIYDPVLGGTYEYFNGATRDSYKGGTHWSIDGGVFTYEVGSYDYGVYFGRSDHLGTPKITTNTSGTVIKTESMGPFGDGFTATGASISDIGFAGGDYDRSGDSNNFGARDYKPIEGRWLSPDPAGLAAVNPSNPQTWNRYAYVGNDPVDYIDPSGLVRTPWGIFGGNISSGWDEFDLLGIPAVGPGSVVEDGGCFGCGTGFDLFGSTDGGSDASMPPENETQPPQTTACTTTILSAVNSQFGTNATPANVINTSSSGQGAGGQATNLQILLAGLPAGQFNSIQPGRYPLSPLTWLTGYGPTLHVTGQTPFDPTASFSNSNVGGITSVNFTAHIDSAFAYNPFGALFHLFIDFLHIGGPRKPC